MSYKKNLIVLRFLWSYCWYQSNFSTVDSQINFTLLSIMPYSKLSAVWIKAGALSYTPGTQRCSWLGVPCQTRSESPFTVKPESNKNQGKQKASNCAIFTVRAAVGGKPSWSAQLHQWPVAKLRLESLFSDLPFCCWSVPHNFLFRQIIQWEWTSFLILIWRNKII